MTTHTLIGRAAHVGCAIAVMLLSAVAASGQQPPAAQKLPAVPLKVDIVLTRFQGEKKMSSLPFSVTPTANAGRVNLRVGVDVPISTQTVTKTSGSPAAAAGTTATTSSEVAYRNVGTSIDCSASSTEDGRFKITLGIQDSSIVSSTPGETGAAAMKAGEPPAFRNFSLNSELTLRDGQTMQFVMATDKITGEVLKVDVTVTVIK